jgi:hypothetical protein
VRVAHANQLKVQTFCDLLFGKHRQVWNRDIDRLAPRWIINSLSRQTGTPLVDAHGTTLSAYRTILYPRRRDSGILQWILPLDIWHRKRMGHGLQFCPACLAEDETPYFRKRWRVALYTFCTRHNIMVHDRCPSCQSGVVFHRLEQGRYGVAGDTSLARCYECGFDLRYAPAVASQFYEDSSRDLFLETLLMLEGEGEKHLNGGFFNVLHHLCKFIISTSSSVKMQKYLIGEIGGIKSSLSEKKRSVEEHGVADRHHVVQLSMWLMADLQNRIVGAWQNKAVRYNWLKKDFSRMPQWYRDIIRECSNWRTAV